MAQLPPIPTGADTSTAEQYIVPADAGAFSATGIWVVDSGWYWLIQSLIAIVADVGVADPGAAPRIVATNPDGGVLINAIGCNVINPAAGESEQAFQASPDVATSPATPQGGLISLPTVWLPPTSQVSFAMVDQAGDVDTFTIIFATLVVTRIHYTGSSQGATADETPLPTPIVP